VDSALKILNRAGYLEYTDEQDNASRLIFTLQRDELYRLQEYDADTEKLINIILRSYTGLFTDYVYINEESLEIRSGLNRQRIYDILVMLTQRRVLHYIPRKKTPYIIYTRERQEKNRIQLTRDVYEDRKESYATRIKAMVEYATAEEKCRSRMLLRYFGEKNENNCGQCDVCLQKHDTGIKQGEYLQWKERILETLSKAPCPVADIAIRLNAEIERIEPIISFLIAEEIIRMDDGVLYLL
jgi:ATP-dependent DNA helicase RecQ